MALRTKRLTCAYCNARKSTEDYPNSTYAQCWTCWLRDNGEKIEPIKRALMELGGNSMTTEEGGT